MAEDIVVRSEQLREHSAERRENMMDEKNSTNCCDDVNENCLFSVSSCEQHQHHPDHQQQRPELVQQESFHYQRKKRKQICNLRYLRKTRSICGAIVNNNRFQVLIVLLIVVNAILLGIGTFNTTRRIEEALERADRAFLILFTAELGIQFIYHGIRMLLDGWLFFDFIVIVLSWSLDSVAVFRSFRIFRALRLISRLKALKDLIEALLSIIPDMGVISALLLLIIYIYAVMCTVLFKDLYKQGIFDYPYFSRLDYSFFTLFQFLTLDSVKPVVREIIDVYPWSWTIFASYLAISSFMLYSLIAAVLCKAVMIVDGPDSDKPDPIVIQFRTLRCIRATQQKVKVMKAQQLQLLQQIQSTLEELNKMNTATNNLSTTTNNEEK